MKRLFFFKAITIVLFLFHLEPVLCMELATINNRGDLFGLIDGDKAADIQKLLNTGSDKYTDKFYIICLKRAFNTNAQDAFNVIVQSGKFDINYVYSYNNHKGSISETILDYVIKKQRINTQDSQFINILRQNGGKTKFELTPLLSVTETVLPSVQTGLHVCMEILRDFNCFCC